MAGRADDAVIRATPILWAVVLSVLLLGGALGPGYTLSYDMVWVPDLALTRDVLGLGSALPRAVPSDAVVAVLDEVTGGALLQKIVLLGTLVGAGTGFAALVRERSTAAQLVAVTLGTWNPYVAERLVLGHWPLLIGYAVLPWLVVRLRAVEEGLPRSVLPLVVLGSLSASSGLMTAVVALAVAGRADARRRLLLLLCLVGANAPWVAAGLTSPASTTTDTVGAVVFGTGDEGMSPGPVAALSFGGIWNVEVVPESRLGLAGLLFTVLLVVVAVAGAVRVARGVAVPRIGALTFCWLLGWGTAVLSWAAPQALGWLGAHVPAGGLLRDGSRLLGMAVPLVVTLVAVAVDGLLDRFAERGLRAVVGVVIALVPVSLMPDVAWGMGGRLEAVDYPASYAEARGAVRDAPAGDALSLPFVAYRAPAWNGGRRVLDPLPRFLARTTVVNDVLVVSGRPVAGEDRRSADVARALAAGTAAERAEALRAAGVSVVVAEQIDGYPSPEVAGETVAGGALTVVELGAAVSAPPGVGRLTAMVAAWAAWWAVLLVALGTAVVHARRKRGRTDTLG
ncbi:hypothetical protein NOCD_05930 [Nocardioides cavernae]|uniref:hypothetical protein n=1 Tax=Nocardioides TaxID=1839 RepID=UPI000B10713B|nr:MULTISPECIES: hypothetical protein [Nocardioides]MCK9823019.1 hypothetical protein [Nocardioides cavernae]